MSRTHDRIHLATEASFHSGEPMRSRLVRVALPAMMVFFLGCGVTHADIDHWKRTQRGPGKITAVLVGARYPRDLRVHAARALIEMKHPNANGLELLQQAMQAMPPADREAIVHDLLGSLRNQMRGAGQQQTSSGPAESQIQAKDAAYLLLRYASADDRRELGNALLEWLMADLNTRALAGNYTAAQIVQAIGPTATDRIAQAFAPSEDNIRVAVEVAKLINEVATDAGKDSAVARLLTVIRYISGPEANHQLRTTAEAFLRRGTGAQTIDPQRLNRAVEMLRDQYLTVLYDALRTLNRPAGTEYLISVAADSSTPMARRKLVLSGIAGQVRANNASALLAIVTATQNTDLELRGLAVDRLGETRASTVLPQLWTLFDSTNGGEQNQEYVFRWKVGEAILKIGGPSIIPTFVQHLTQPRNTPRGAPPFEGYTYREINGYALTIGDFSPAPRDVMRGLLANPNPYVRAMALLFLGAKGEATDLPRMDALVNDQTAIAGPGWQAEQVQTVGQVAMRAREALRRTLGRPSAASTTATPAQ